MTEEKNEIRNRMLSNIEEHGCHIIHVFEDDEGPAFTYSIGIEETAECPELLVTGLEQELAMHIINDYYAQVKSGKTFLTEQKYPEFLEGFDIEFKEVDRTYYDDYVGQAQNHYGSDDFRVMQLIWPSKQGDWPWEPEATEGYLYYMPLLSK